MRRETKETSIHPSSFILSPVSSLNPQIPCKFNSSSVESSQNMRSSIANLKENLNKIALDVHDDDDDDDELLIPGRDSSYSDRRFSHSFAHSKSSSDSPMPNGIDSPYVSEIEHYKVEIKKLRESEAEIKALSVNYAALLKEKEDLIARLNEENGSLKQNLEEASRMSANNLNVLKGGQEQSSYRQNKHLVKNRSGSQWQNGVVSKQDGHVNGFADSASKSIGHEKELADMLEEKNRILAAVQADHELHMKRLRMELEKERETLANTKLKLEGSITQELNILKSDRDKTSFELNKLRKDVADKASEIKRLQTELSRRESEAGDSGTLRRVIARLEKENFELKKCAVTSFPGKDELEQSLHKVEKDLKETRKERDKALQELARLKQHLLDKEMEESEKMDEDSKIIEELRAHVEYQKATILNLERALQQARASQEEVKMMNEQELQKSKEIIDDLKKKLAGFMSTIDAKNTELLNLQTALGQYYAEIEAKERLEGELSLAREECSKLSHLLQDSNLQVEASKKEKEEILAKLAQAENVALEWKNRVNKLEEDNGKLRRALEQSMTRLNRMSVDSDFLVDRRIVIKLLVTYFQRNHSKEVLDLMVRVLGFSDEDKQRIGVAQQGTGKGVVRGVLGLPGRLVGGIIGGGGSSGIPGTPTNMASDGQSFADLWVDFLLKESEERQKRESMEAKAGANAGSSSALVAASPVPEAKTGASGRPPIFSSTNPSLDTSRSPYAYQSTRQYDSSSEFSTVPLTPSGRQF
ncbi:hypothetical protein Cgig2_002323 [Carnegiea gigantea]|uniref:Golgin candidate 4 n=1 Tax=Carnegiea gigantea TaxID=171969 RepID=A0A9Q1JZG6_9CARY|nr:hypothetical protein Cgig2_002323 [Carnegiea gigantea]